MNGFNIGSVPLGEHDADWLKVMARLGGKNTRVAVASILGYYVRRRKAEYMEILRYTAAKHGLTPEETFKRLLRGEELGEAVEGFEISFEPEASTLELD